MGVMIYLLAPAALVLGWLIGYHGGVRVGHDLGCRDTINYLMDVGMDEDTFESYMKGN